MHQYDVASEKKAKIQPCESWLESSYIGFWNNCDMLVEFYIKLGSRTWEIMKNSPSSGRCTLDGPKVELLICSWLVLLGLLKMSLLCCVKLLGMWTKFVSGKKLLILRHTFWTARTGPYCDLSQYIEICRADKYYWLNCTLIP